MYRTTDQGATHLTTTPSTEFKELRALILHPQDHEGEGLLRCVQRLGCEARLCWPPERRPSAADLLFCLVTQQTRTLFEECTVEAETAIVAIVEPNDGAVLRFLHDVTPHGVLVKPIAPPAVAAQIMIARQTMRYQRRLLTKIAKLEETLRLFRKVEQAKTLLMAKGRLDEPKAYAYLREQAMRRRLPVGVIAAAIVESSELLAADRDQE